MGRRKLVRELELPRTFAVLPVDGGLSVEFRDDECRPTALFVSWDRVNYLITRLASEFNNEYPAVPGPRRSRESVR